MRSFIGSRGLANLTEKDVHDVIAHLRTLNVTDDTQLAVDGEGRLHLMLTAADLASDAVVSTLVETQAWAAEHRALIALTCPQLAVDADPDPTIHVFTDEPKSYARLAYGAQMAGPPIRLHLLRTVALGAERMWVHEALN